MSTNTTTHEANAEQLVARMDQQDERYATMYLQHVDMDKKLTSVITMLTSMRNQQAEDKSFASFTASMVTIVIVVATLSVAAVFLFSR